MLGLDLLSPLRRAAARQFTWPAVLLLAAAVSLYCWLFVGAWTPVLLTGDFLIYLDNAARMMRGEIMYRDFGHFLLPGTEFVFLACFKLFGARMSIPNALLLLIGVALALLGWAISRRFLPDAFAVLPSLIFLALGYRRFLDLSHHWFCTAASVAALVVLLYGISKLRLALAGTLCGLALCFTHLRGLAVILAFVLFLVLRRAPPCGRLLRELCWLVLPAVAVVSACVALVAVRAPPADLYRWLILFPIMRYSTMHWNNFGAYMAQFPDWEDAYRHPGATLGLGALYVFVPFVCFASLALWKSLRSRITTHLRDPLLLLLLFNAANLMSVARSPDYARLAAISLPVFVVAAVMWHSFAPLRARTAALVVACSVLLLVGKSGAMYHANDSGRRIALPTGVVACSPTDPACDLFDWLSVRVRPEHTDVFDSDWSTYFPLGARNPSPVPFIADSDYTQPEEVQQTIRALTSKQVRYVVWDPPFYDTYPGQDHAKDHLPPLRSFLRAHYHFVKVVGEAEIWERNQAATRSPTDLPRAERE
jgi:hypothetical protein